MSATAIAADPTGPFAKTESTTAFDQDNRQHEELFSLYVRRSCYRHSQHLLSKERLGDGIWGLCIGGSGQDAETTPSVANRIHRNPWADFSAELEQSSDRLRNDTFNAYRARIEMLKVTAEDEGIVFNDTSEQDFWKFMRSVPYTLKAEIVVTDSGNLRAVWRGDEVKHVGLQFLGGRRIEYVMWTRRTGSVNLWTKADRDTFEGVKEQIRASKLASFLQ